MLEKEDKKHKIVVCSDIHLDHLSETRRDKTNNTFFKVLTEEPIKEFCENILKHQPNSIIISGDISVSNELRQHLSLLSRNLQDIPIYYICGNHDFYHNTITETRYFLNELNKEGSNLYYLSLMEPIQLTERTMLIGHDGWYDGEYASFEDSQLYMNDLDFIQEFIDLERISNGDLSVLYNKMKSLAQESADYILLKGHEACIKKGVENLIVVTHVPPFKNNSRGPNGEVSNKDWLPYMSSRRMGEALVKLAETYKDVKITCLCGHTHSFHSEYHRKNLLCVTGQADHKYKNPSKSIRTLEVD